MGRNLDPYVSSIIDKPQPVLKEDGSDLTDAVEIAASSMWACALDTHDAVYCWGLPVLPVSGAPHYAAAHDMSL